MEDRKTLYIVSRKTDTAFANQVWQEICRLQTEAGKEPVPIIVLSEEQWMVQKEALGDVKVLFIGPIQLMEEVAEQITPRFEKYGVRYGWEGNHGCLLVNTRMLRRKAEYQRFLEELKAGYPVDQLVEKPKEMPPWQMVGLLCVALFVPFGSVLAGGKLMKNWFDNETAVKKQQYIYGLMHLYRHYLGEFMGNSGT